MRKIKALSYQRKITGYGKDSVFPTEMTVIYMVGETCPAVGMLMDKVKEIRMIEDGYEVDFEKGWTLCISEDKKPDVLYEN